MIKILDPDNPYYILVPKSDDFSERLYRYEIYNDKGVDTDAFLYIEFREEFYYEIEQKLFDFINKKCNLYINMYEEEVIEPEKLPTVLDLTKNSMANLSSEDDKYLDFCKEFIRLINYAIEHQVPVGLYF